MRIFILSLIFILTTSGLKTQELFSRLYDLDLPNVIFTGLEILDEEVLVSGVVRDTTNGFRLTHGLVFTDFEGNILRSQIYREEGVSLQPWRYLVRHEDKLFHFCYGFTDESLNYEGLILCFDTLGNHLWTERIPGLVEDHRFFLYTDACVVNDRLFVLGHNSIDAYSLSAVLVIAEYTLDGEFVQYSTLSTQGQRDLSYVIKSLGDTSLVIGSHSDNLNTNNRDFILHSRLWITDLEGNIQQSWSSIAEELQHGIRDFAISEDSGFVIAGSQGIEIPINIENSDLRWDCYVYKLSSELEFEWGTFFRHNVPGSFHHLDRIISVADGSGFVTIGHSSAYYGGDDIEVENIGDWGALVAKVSPAGDSLWSRIIIHPDHPSFQEDDKPHDIKELPDGSFMIAGESGHVLAPPSQQGWLLRIDEHGCLVPGCHLVSSTEEILSPEQIQLLLYPNPVVQQLHVYVPTSEIEAGANLVIWNEKGQMIKKINIAATAATYVLDVSAFPAGNYHLQIIDRNGRKSEAKLFIKQ